MHTEKDSYISPGLRDRPLPIPRPPGSPAPKNPTAPRRELFKNRSALDIIQQHTGFKGGPQPKRTGYHLTIWSLMASLIDTLILISISCVFLLAFSFVLRHTGLHESLNLHINQSLKKTFFAVFLLCSWVYMVVLRVLMGSSIGEWACDLRLGQPQERMKALYPLKVIGRESLILLTGIITLPILSLLLGRDMAGKLSGLQLFSLK